MNLIKSHIIQHLHIYLDKKIASVTSAIQSAIESRDSDTKSSAGDKHETSRAMMQIELDQNEGQLNKLIKLKNEINQLDLNQDFNLVKSGSLVTTNEGQYFISIGIGKIEVNNQDYFAISLASPIGLLLKNKKPGDKLQFQEREIEITKCD